MKPKGGFGKGFGKYFVDKSFVVFSRFVLLLNFLDISSTAWQRKFLLPDITFYKFPGTNSQPDRDR